MQTWAQGRTSAARAALIFALEPAFAALVSVALGRERLGAAEVVGGGLIVAGVALAEALRAPWTHPIGKRLIPLRNLATGALCVRY